MRSEQSTKQAISSLGVLRLPRGDLNQRRSIEHMKSPEKEIGTLAMDLRAAVTAFVEQDLRSKKTPHHERAIHDRNSQLLKSRLAKASKVLDKLHESKAGEGIQHHVRDLQVCVDNFRVYLLRNEFRTSPSKHSLTELLYTSLAFKSELSDILEGLLTEEESISQAIVENF